MISVVVPVRNGMPWLEDQLAALVSQECPVPWEVVIADNGSTDGSPSVGRGWADRHDAVRWIDASAVRGPAAARNAGARSARGDLIAFCDADDVARPGWLGGCLTALEGADVVAGLFDFSTLNGTPDTPPQAATTRQLGFLPAGLAANLAVRRQAFEAVGGFAEELLVGEDIDLCWRLQLKGFRLELAPGAVVSKREHADDGGGFRHALAYGRSGPTLYRRYRSSGARRDWVGAAKGWLWLALHSPSVLTSGRPRQQWIHAAGVRVGRLQGSVRTRVFFP